MSSEVKICKMTNLICSKYWRQENVRVFLKTLCTVIVIKNVKYQKINQINIFNQAVKEWTTQHYGQGLIRKRL
jgi:hypothetical protein